MKKTTTRKCRNRECKKEFTPMSATQTVCSMRCSFVIQNKLHEKFRKDLAKKQRKETKESKEKLKTNQDYVKELQKIFNTFIRERDRGRQCICCERSLEGKYDAGHYFPAGSYPMIRFDEDNCHGQTVHCNRDKHANLAEYTIHLPIRIGQERFDALLKRRLKPRKYTIPELKEMKIEYKSKIKALTL